MKSFLCVLNGETFRLGGQMSRDRCGVSSISRQKLATMSHIRFLKYIQHKFNLNIHILIVTYKTKDKENSTLLSWYTKFFTNINYFLLDSSSPNENTFITHVNKYIKNINYLSMDYIFYCRIDIYIKEYFNSVLYLDDNNIILAHKDINGYDETKNTYNFISHIFTLVPKKHIEYYINNNIQSNICDIHKYISNYYFFIESPHFLSTNLGFNPIFTNTSRPESHEYTLKSFYEKYKDLYGKDKLEDNLIKYNFADSLDIDDINL
jgi:hypothetical protein